MQKFAKRCILSKFIFKTTDDCNQNMKNIAAQILFTEKLRVFSYV